MIFVNSSYGVFMFTNCGWKIKLELCASKQLLNANIKACRNIRVAMEQTQIEYHLPIVCLTCYFEVVVVAHGQWVS